MKRTNFFLLSILLTCSIYSQNNKEIETINTFMNQWHEDVANVDFEAYFNKLSSNSIFIGTDASEIWTKKQFEEFAKPHFDKKKTWDFKTLDRNIYFSKDQKIVWFDELLNTWMGICRGSGVIIKNGKSWEIAHYVLSITIPNDDIKGVIEIKRVKDSIILLDLKK